MTEMLPDPPELDPAALAATEFGRARRGLEPAEVRAALGRAADALRAWQVRDHQLQSQLESARQELDQSHEMDEQRIATVLGEETARIVTAAREAAAEIRSKAEEQAERLLREADERATAQAEALRSEAQALHDRAAEERDDAVAEATRVREEASTEVAELRATAAAETATLREEAAALATSTVSDAQARSDELLAAAETVLAERTAAAEDAAAGITAAAEEDVARAEATAAAMVEEATRAATELLADAEQHSATVRSAAAEESEQLIEAARERGRDMVRQAREVRERMLADLAERRRIARRQIEAALAGRDRIVEVLRDANASVATTIGELDHVDEEAGLAADAAATAADADLDAEIEALHAELDAAEVVLAADDEDSGHEEPDGTAPPAVGAAVEEVVVAETIVTEEGAATIVVDAEVIEIFEPAAAGDADDDDADDLSDDDADTDDEPAEDGDDGDGATVHDLFARIRAEGLEDDDGEADDASGAEPAAPVASIDLTDAGAEPAADAAVGETAVAVLDGEQAVLDRRDQVLVPIEKRLSRALKRLASDEQNEILDRLRRVKRGRPDPDEILPAVDPEAYVDALAADFGAAVQAGAEFWTELAGDAAGAPEPDDPAARERLAVRVGEFVSVHRVQLERTFAESDEAGLDAAEVGDRVRAAYRDWRSGSLADLAGDLSTSGFTFGEQVAAGPGTPWRWLVDNGGLPCPDGEDNALAGEVGCSEPFPTGDVTPPAHPGCRCILAPARR